MMDPTVIARLCPALNSSVALEWGEALSQAAEEFGITTEAQQARWLANLLHESAGLTVLEENLNYSAKRLAQVWPSRYAVDPRAIDKVPNKAAIMLGGEPELIASDVYANRMGNGPPGTHDGWRFRGRYPLQLTGRANYEAANLDLGIPDLGDPDALLKDIPGMARVCGWFWQHRGLGAHADFIGVVKAWNGGTIGLEDRQKWLKQASVILSGTSTGDIA